MINPDHKRERYLKDPLPRRLGGMKECQYYIEWTAAEAKPNVAAELVDIQVALSLWRRIWLEAKQNQGQRTLLSFQAKKWSDQVLDWSGLLESN